MGCGSSKSTQEIEGSQPRASTSLAAVPNQTPAPGPSQAAAPILYEQQDTSRHASIGSQSKAEPSGHELREAIEKPLIIFVIGGPGCGKGTQCKKLLDKYGGGLRHLSTGDLLRSEAARGSNLGKKLQATMKSGALVSDDQVIELLEKEINESAWFGLAFLVDGFPRTAPQAKKFEQQIRPCDMVLYFECSEKVMLDRLTSRSKQSGRQDDNAKTIKERLKLFKKETLPVVELFKKEGKLYRFSAEPGADEIFAEVEPILDGRLGKEASVSETARAESSEWRMPQVIDIENRFYGTLKKERE